MNLLQLLDRDLGVNLGRRELGMTQQLLDKPDVCSAFEHQRGAGVPEQVARAPVATGQSFSGYIRHSASRAARTTREKGVHHSTVSPLRGAICAKMEMKVDISRIPKECILTRKRYISYY